MKLFFYQSMLVLSVLSSSPVMSMDTVRHFSLHIKVPSTLSGKVIYLKIWDYYSNNRYALQDSVKVTGGSVTFDGILHKPCEEAKLTMTDENVAWGSRLLADFVIDSGLNDIVINNFDIHDPNYYYDGHRVYNSTSNDLQMKLKKLESEFTERYAVAALPGKPGEGMPEDKLQQLLDMDLQLLQEDPANFYNIIYLRKLINKAAFQSAANRLTLLKTFNALDVQLKTSPLGRETAAIITADLEGHAASAIGKEVPVFSIRTDRNNLFKNADLLGHPYIIAFSATWCMPCQEVLPVLMAAYDQYKDRGLQVVYFNLDNNIVKWHDHIQKHQLTWINVSERTKFLDSKIAKQFNIYSIPVFLIIDRNGRIVYNSNQMDQEMQSFNTCLQQVME